MSRVHSWSSGTHRKRSYNRVLAVSLTASYCQLQPGIGSAPDSAGFGTISTCQCSSSLLTTICANLCASGAFEPSENPIATSPPGEPTLLAIKPTPCPRSTPILMTPLLSVFSRWGFPIACSSLWVFALLSINLTRSDSAISRSSRVNVATSCTFLKQTCAIRNGRFPGAHPYNVPAKAKAVKTNICDLRVCTASRGDPRSDGCR